MQSLVAIKGLVICQKKEWGEILTDFETKNRYVVLEPSGRELYLAVEEGGSMFLRFFLKALRPFEINMRRLDNQPVLRLKRPFRFYFHELVVYGQDGALLGSIKRRFSLLRRIYSVIGPHGRQILQLFGPILHPWTFEIRDEIREYGKITKKWSGLLKEGFTDADNFAVTFPAQWPIEQKAVLLGAVFLIDFVHFENAVKKS